MHEPFYPLPLPTPPESGLDSLLARVARRLAARLRRRRRPSLAVRRARESSLAASQCPPKLPNPPLRFPLHPPGF
ncbi:MAG TPA: hypothetical protein VMR66_05145 [Gemmatimonadota bacterium]|nr:hypothetical protein [Gemmatimonadota bacterium]